MAKIIGLTGGIASGKTTVAKLFNEYNIPVIDTDKIAHMLLNKDSDVYYRVIDVFGDDILYTNKEINRKKLGRIIFGNVGKRNQLNEIVHPEVLKVVDSEIKIHEKNNEKLVVIDVPLLYETEFDQYMDQNIVVYVDYDTQIERLMHRDRIDKEYAQMKIKAQMPLSDKVKRADFVIDNGQSILETKNDFLRILKELEV